MLMMYFFIIIIIGPADINLDDLIDKDQKPQSTRFWTPDEIENLKEGYKKYGARWTSILNDPEFSFNDRSVATLCSKWRQITRETNGRPFDDDELNESIDTLGSGT
eukprot:Pgem_evm1s9880